ncbi:hypothetical protein ACFFLZ_16150 [Photobacterium aphoticum]|nr:hypothetical protein [Photobacterium aphoticum]PSU58578.1 hypothetical protein C9I90_06410 [Photobacterium aphoticum]GHA48029.1 hypothetical protein GCM10007086_22080 [Photobacterium aphoticum]
MSKSGQKMTPEAAAQIQSSEAKHHGGKVAKDSFSARVQRAAEKNQKNK